MQQQNSIMEEHQTMIEDCEARESRLSDWERSFIDSIKRKLTEGRTLTKNEASKLDDVWEHATARG